MEAMFGGLVLLSFVAFCVGLIKPALILPPRFNPSRGKSSVVYLGLFLIMAIIGGQVSLKNEAERMKDPAYAAAKKKELEDKAKAQAVAEAARKAAEELVARKAGLGDTFSNIDAAWNTGYKREYPQAERVEIGSGEDTHFVYQTGLPGRTFGNPVRAGWFDGGAPGFNGIFGESKERYPSRRDFFLRIQDLMPKDFVLKEAYIREQGSDASAPWRKEIYIFESALLAKLPGIESSVAYDKSLDTKPGDFKLIVHYSPDGPDRIGTFTLCLGGGVGVDEEGMTKASLNPFKE